MVRRTLLVTLAVTAIAADAPPSGDLLDQARRMNQVAVLQVEADTKLALREAERLATAEPAKAVEKLQQLLASLESDQKLAPERRDTLVRVVKDRIRVAQAATDKAAVEAEGAKARAVAEVARKADDDKLAADSAQLKAGINAIAQLRKEGKIAEASQKANELLQHHPQKVAVQVLNGVNTLTNELAAAVEVRKEKEAGVLHAMRDIDRAAILPKGDIEFPKDWKEKTERRLKGQRLSEEEIKILQALNSTMKPEFRSSRLQDVVDYLSTVSGRAILIDKSALDEAGFSYDTQVSFVPRHEVSMRNVLRSVLGQVGLTYVVRDNVIQVTSPPRARDMMVTKSYVIGDLVAVTGLFGGAPQWGMALDQAQLGQNVAGVVEMIQSTIDPQSWRGRGGEGLIGFNVPTMSLIIRQSAEVHAMIRGGLYK
jgi:hypothetical protein